MALEKPSVIWSAEAVADLKSIYYYLLKRNSPETALRIRNEIFRAPHSIIFAEQFQIDDIYNKYRRIIIRNYKILYTVDKTTLNIVTILNSHNANPGL